MDPLNNTVVMRRPVNIQVRMMKYETDVSCLMDFESRKYMEDRTTITPSQQGYVVFLVKQGHKLVTIADKESLETYLRCHREATVLARLMWSDKGCFLCHPDNYGPTLSGDSCFAVMSNKLCRRIIGRKAKPMNHVIKEGDRIKFGRSTLLVRYLAHRPVNSLTYLHNLLGQDSTSGVKLEVEEVIQPTTTTTTPTTIMQNADVAGTGTLPSNIVTRNTGDGINETESDSTVYDSAGNEETCPSAEEKAIGSASTTPGGMENADQKICRICLEGDESGPLVVPCQCRGSMKYVHLTCVRTWVHGRLKVNDDNGSPHLSYFLQKLRCELCNVAYPSYVEVGTVVTEFLGIDEPRPPYAVLEPENSPSTGLHLATLVNGTIAVGRGSHSAVMLHDISVSRLHALLLYKDGQFVVEDQGSKFGTLVQIDPEFNLPVDVGAPVMLKIGNDILCVSAKPVRSLASLLCCGCFSSLFNHNAVRVSM